jgi:hypothetical protein
VTLTKALSNGALQRQFFAKFGAFLCLTVGYSWFWANFFFLAVMSKLGPCVYTDASGARALTGSLPYFGHKPVDPSNVMAAGGFTKTVVDNPGRAGGAPETGAELTPCTLVAGQPPSPDMAIQIVPQKNTV